MEKKTNDISNPYSTIKDHWSPMTLTSKDPFGTFRSFGRMIRSHGSHFESLQPVTLLHVESLLITIEFYTNGVALGIANSLHCRRTNG